jgi:hypothetical protein
VHIVSEEKLNYWVQENITADTCLPADGQHEQAGQQAEVGNRVEDVHRDLYHNNVV